jgi:DNA-binding NarL/FixJ family response regulator
METAISSRRPEPPPQRTGRDAVRILIADDHPVVRSGLRQILSAENDMTVVGEAKDGDEALALARSVDWDVAVLDFSMPGRSGLDLLKEIKREFPGRPILVLSMFPEELHALQVFKVGGSGYLNKESANDQLTAAIRKVRAGGKFVSAAMAERLASEFARQTQKPLHETLSDREYRVMWLLASGKKISEIADEMELSPSTVSTHRIRVLRKLHLSNNAELVRYAIENALVG